MVTKSFINDTIFQFRILYDSSAFPFIKCFHPSKVQYGGGLVALILLSHHPTTGNSVTFLRTSSYCGGKFFPSKNPKALGPEKKRNRGCETQVRKSVFLIISLNFNWTYQFKIFINWRRNLKPWI